MKAISVSLALLLAPGLMYASKPSGRFTWDATRLYIDTAEFSADSYVDNLTIDTDGGVMQGQTWHHDDYRWKDGVGGGGFAQSVEQADEWIASSFLDGWTNVTTWQTSWDSNDIGTEIYTDAYGSATNTVGVPFSVGEYCLVDDPKSPPPTLQSLGDDNWVTNAVREEYVRYDQTRWRLQTGPEAWRGALWHFTCQAWEIVDKRAQPPYPDSSKRPIAPQNIMVMGRSFDTNGNLWVALPSGTNFDVTPFVAGKRFYTYQISFQKYAPHIVANGNGLDTNSPEFCVGQNITLQASWTAETDAGISDAQPPPLLTQRWVNFQNYVDLILPTNGEASAQYLLDYSLLTNSTASVWCLVPGSKVVWYNVSADPSGTGQPVTCYTGGEISYAAPTIVALTNFSQRGVNFYPDIQVLTFGDQQGNGIAWDLILQRPAQFGGSAWYTQLVKRDRSYNDSYPITHSFSTGGLYWLDNEDHYADPVNMSLTGRAQKDLLFSDAPGISGNPPQSFFTFAEMQDDFHTYVRFQADSTNSIPVTVGRIDWGWHGRAETFSGDQPVWSLVTSNWFGAVPDWSDHAPVQWSHTYVNRE